MSKTSPRDVVGVRTIVALTPRPPFNPDRITLRSPSPYPVRGSLVFALLPRRPAETVFTSGNRTDGRDGRRERDRARIVRRASRLRRNQCRAPSPTPLPPPRHRLHPVPSHRRRSSPAHRSVSSTLSNRAVPCSPCRCRRRRRRPFVPNEYIFSPLPFRILILSFSFFVAVSIVLFFVCRRFFNNYFVRNRRSICDMFPSIRSNHRDR